MLSALAFFAALGTAFAFSTVDSRDAKRKNICTMAYQISVSCVLGGDGIVCKITLPGQGTVTAVDPNAAVCNQAQFFALP